MPRLTTRAMAELLRLPAYAQIRILTEQKYPRQGPQAFRTPFYSPALAGIRDFYRLDNDGRALARARQAIAQLRLPSRRLNNDRVLDAFEASDQYTRVLEPQPRRGLAATIGDVEIRLSLDLQATQDDEPLMLYYNCRAAAVDADTARTTLEIAKWVLDENGVPVPRSALEYVDFSGRRVFRLTRPRGATVRQLRATARVIEALWGTI
jgi:hypothetical protein